jgi:hypothetical protein
MSKVEKAVEAKAEIVTESAESIVDALFDLGTAWAEYGIGYGKFALESSARVLSRTADALAQIQERLKKDAA